MGALITGRQLEQLQRDVARVAAKPMPKPICALSRSLDLVFSGIILENNQQFRAYIYACLLALLFVEAPVDVQEYLQFGAAQTWPERPGEVCMRSNKCVHVPAHDESRASECVRGRADGCTGLHVCAASTEAN